MEKKKTLRENFEEIKTFIESFIVTEEEGEEVNEETQKANIRLMEWSNFLTERITLLDNKKSKISKSSKENDELKGKIYNHLLEKKEGATITELMGIFELSNQKLSAMCNQMIKEEKPRLKREVGKNKKITFKAIAPSEENENIEV